jgi:hypothetical protein
MVCIVLEPGLEALEEVNVHVPPVVICFNNIIGARGPHGVKVRVNGYNASVHNLVI